MIPAGIAPKIQRFAPWMILLSLTDHIYPLEVWLGIPKIATFKNGYSYIFQAFLGVNFPVNTSVPGWPRGQQHQWRDQSEQEAAFQATSKCLSLIFDQCGPGLLSKELGDIFLFHPKDGQIAKDGPYMFTVYPKDPGFPSRSRIPIITRNLRLTANTAPENGWLEDEFFSFLLGVKGLFSGDFCC